MDRKWPDSLFGQLILLMDEDVASCLTESNLPLKQVMKNLAVETDIFFPNPRKNEKKEKGSKVA